MDRARCGGHLAKGYFVIDRAVAPGAKRLDLIKQVALDQPPVGRRVDGLAQDGMKVSRFDGTKRQPATAVDEDLRPKRKGPVPAIEAWAFKVEPDFIALEDRNAWAFGDEEWPQRVAKCGTVGIIGKEAISQRNELRGDALLHLDGMGDKAMSAGRALEKGHEGSPAGQACPAQNEG